MAELSPMMQQYWSIKENHPNTILMFRLGDFYEMFFKDAEIASEELELTLTGRECGQEERAPMCGVPYHSSEAYIGRLVKKGYKVAICEQTEDPAQAKGLVKREVVRVVTPSTLVEEDFLDESQNNYLSCVAYLGGCAGLCSVDSSTGALHLVEIKGDDLSERLISELGRFQPSEVLLNHNTSDLAELTVFLSDRLDCVKELHPDEDFESDRVKQVILNHFGKDSLDELNLQYDSAGTAAVGCALAYLYETRRTGLENINMINIYTDSQFMRLDLSALRNLELLETMRNKEKKGSLLWVLDKTKTAMGKRLIRSWLKQPLKNVTMIDKRLNAVDELYSDGVLRGELREHLKGVGDVERLMTKVVYGTAMPKDLNALALASHRFPQLKELLGTAKSAMLHSSFDEIDPLSDIYSLITAAIVDGGDGKDIPNTVRKGGIIKEGYNLQIDMLKNNVDGGQGKIALMEAKEREETGIPKLKIRYNRVFGYYIEVSNSYTSLVPDRYIRKQTLSNCERYFTEELKALEESVLGGGEQLVDMEYEQYKEILDKISAELSRFQKTASAIAVLDVLCSFAEISTNNAYCRPNLSTTGKLRITGGRHPVVEAVLKSPFVPNDTVLDTEDNRCAIITGPNMAGKSTYMRQVAIIALMAQVGCFVPAASADIGVVDAIYTRVGASDDLSAGQSTFMVEMSEVAFILRNATSSSLLILDEIGRGTSTYDGMSIARAVLEYTADKRKLGAKTLFATHYHELTSLEGQLNGAKNYNIAVKKRGDEITFLRRIVRGGADDSYGIEVAKLAGIPDTVINRAKKILSELESGDVLPSANGVTTDNPVDHDPQFSFVGTAEKELVEHLKQLDVNTLTPIEAMTKLFEITSKARSIT